MIKHPVPNRNHSNVILNCLFMIFYIFILFLNGEGLTMTDLTMTYKKTRNQGDNFICLVLIIGFSIGTFTHIIDLIDIIKYGFFKYAELYHISPLLNAYWISLTIVDPLIVLLLLKNIKIGAIAGFINIFINVVVNSSYQLINIDYLTLSIIVDKLGTIYNSLQIALLLFSALTLPILLAPQELDRRAQFYPQAFGQIPLVVLSMGLLIHIVGLAHLINNFSTIWIAWVHISMTVIDSVLIILIFNRLRLAYILALLGFGIFGALQAGMAIGNFFGLKVGFNLEGGIALTLCCLAIASLLTNKNRFTKKGMNLFPPHPRV